MEEFFHSGMHWKILNFVVFAAVLFFALRKAVVAFWLGRHQSIRAQIEEARQLKQTTEERNHSLKKRISAIEQEVTQLIDELKKDGDLEKAQLMAQAEKYALRLKEDTTKIIRQEYQRAKELLRNETVHSAMQLSEKLIRENLRPDDQKKLGADMVKQLEQQLQ